ncbi:MAG TPA: aminopeptidase, partial [Trueperaceae bacterium]
DDPVARWQDIAALQDRLIERLQDAKEVHIVAEGTDLKLSVEGRAWVNSAGHRNMPSGEVFTGPIENSANGHITFTIPSAVNGVEVENVRLAFQDGKVVDAHADKGDDLLQSQLATDEGARYLGELGIGTNANIQIPTKSILFDEKIGGTVHLALGRSYAETLGVNESAIHWDMICDLRQGGAIYLDGELFEENGSFKL